MENNWQNWLNGNDKAFRKLFDYYYPLLFTFCNKSIKSHQDCEEIVQDVFTQLWAKKNYLLKVSNFEGYLLKIVRHRISSFFRKKQAEEEAFRSYQHEYSIPDSTYHHEKRLKKFKLVYDQAVAQLPEQQKKVFIMSREEGLSHKTIAQVSQLSTHTVNNHIKAALKNIRQNVLKDMGEAL